MLFPRRSRRRGALGCALFLVLTCAVLDMQPSGADSSFTRTSGRPFTTSSAWNTPIVGTPALDPRSSAQVSYLAGFAHPGIANIGAYGVPVWDADASTPKYTIDCTESWGTCGLERQPVPIPAGAEPSPGSDGAMVVIDWSTRTAYEFWRAERVSPTQWSAAWGGTVSIDGTGTPGAAVGAGISRLAGVVRTFEVAAQSIPHALVFSTNNACTSIYRYPASKTDGNKSRSDCLPEGARLQLDPALNVDALPGLTSAERMVAKALQVYGAYVIDNGGAPMAFIFETPSGEASPYCAAGLCSDYSDLDGIPWNRLRVLAAWDGPSNPPPSTSPTTTSPPTTAPTTTTTSPPTTAPPTISVANVKVAEPDSGTADAVVPVTLSSPASSNTTVSFSTQAGSGTPGLDYSTTSGAVVIPKGMTAGSIVVPIEGDMLHEANEFFTVRISSTSAPIADASARVVITNDDPKPGVTVSNVSATEGSAGTKALRFTARLATVSGVPCNLTLATSDATATAGSDYVAATSRVTIPAGSRTATFPVTILGDQSREPNESLVVVLSAPARCVRGNQEAVGSIRNDD